MPEISRFNGMTISMRWDDHNWPHFHVHHAEYSASFHLRQMRITRGYLPRNLERRLSRWAHMNEEALWANWHRAQNG